MITIDISGTIPFHLMPSVLDRSVQHAFRFSRTRKGFLNIAFVTPSRMQALNRRYRGKNRPTDVLSFDAGEKQISGILGWLGDIVICPAVVKTEAARRRIDPSEELLRVLIHGCLHLQGLDHATEEEETRMFSLQEEYVAKVFPL